MTQITWIGHSTVLVDERGVRLLTDPLLRARIGHVARAVPFDGNAVGAVDAVLVSHVHRDHLDIPSLRLLRPRPEIVVPRGAGRLVIAKLGFAHVTELAPGESVSIGSLEVRATRAEHDARRNAIDRPVPALGYVIEGSERIYFAGDTDLFPGMADLASGLDLALLPIAGWGPRLPPGHLDPVRAAEALALLRPRLAIPIHWGTYRRLGMSRDPSVMYGPAKAFVRAAAHRAPEVTVEVLQPGERVDLSARLHHERNRVR